MILNILILIIGFSLLIEGANILIDGGVSLANRYNISHSIIGLTIIAAGTSAPEYAVSFIGALSGESSISIGNVVGSNILNVGFVLGFVTLIVPLIIKTREIKKDAIILIVISFLFFIFASNGVISHLEGIIFLLIFIGYLYYCYVRKSVPIDAEEIEEHKEKSMLKIILFIIGGIIGLGIGGKLTVYSAKNIALSLGVSEIVISLTIVALGTSLPEFLTSLIAVIKKHNQIGVGNIIGSNIFNILFCLGSSAAVINLKFNFRENMVSIVAMAISSILLYVAILGNKIKRYEGIVLIILYMVYILYLVT